MSFEPLVSFDPPAAALADLLARVDEERRAERNSRRSPVEVERGREALRIELTYHSNAIEGNTLTLRETQAVFEGRTPGEGKDLREIYEARNGQRALARVETWAADGSAIDESRLLELHAILMADILLTTAGSYRTGRVRIGGTGYVPPGPHRFGVLMPELLRLASRTGVHPILLAAEAHYNVAAVHPFEDGNGRTARLVMNWILLRAGYPLTMITREQRGEYLRALDEANGGRWEPFATLVARRVLVSVCDY